MPMVGGKEYPYTEEGKEAANKARMKAKNNAQKLAEQARRYSQVSGSSDKKPMPTPPSQGKSKPKSSLPKGERMPYRVGQKPKIQKGPYKGGDYKKQLLKAKLDSLSKKKK